MPEKKKSQIEILLKKQIEKKDTSAIRISILKYANGNIYLDIREFFKVNPEDEEWRPSKKGVNMPLLFAYDLQKEFNEALESEEAINVLEQETKNG